jgi:diguanylate cyclase (GGDEF)-like protein
MKLLVADGSCFYREWLKALLEAWNYEVVLAADGYAVQSILDSDAAPSLAILDCLMPGISGLDLCELIRAREQSYVYTILLGPAGQPSDLLKGLELGADEYLQKPFDELELRARLKVGERIIRSREELVETREALEFEASHDSLLRIWNRRAIMDLLRKELKRANRFQTAVSVLLADLDFFKRVNDRYGHLAGDDVLRSAAGLICSAVRDYDQVGRYGGDEFFIVLPNCTAEAARGVAERVRQRIRKKPVVHAPVQVELTASIGVSQWHSGQEIRDLLHQADVALYRAKQNGRDRVEVEDHEPPGLNMERS